MRNRTFYVGGDSEYQSLSKLFLALKDDFSEKTVYIHPGVYDIYKEYRELGMETPPDDITAGDYLDRCVFLPANTTLIGLGSVLLKWAPAKDEITKGEARTWSPLNVRYACRVENITVFCHYGRYCIHDDSHNAPEDQGVVHSYKNVRCHYEYSDDLKGFNNTIGFGFSQKNSILFEDCELTMDGCPENDPYHSAFYGHGAEGADILEEESPHILLKNCIFLGGRSDNFKTVRLQCLNSVPLRIRTVIEGCRIEGGIYLTLCREGHCHAYDVTLLRSGHPQGKADKPETNPYRIRYFE